MSVKRAVCLIYFRHFVSAILREKKMQIMSNLAHLFNPGASHVSYPMAKILVNSVDVTSNILPLLMDMEITDDAGFESDSIALTVANPMGNIAIPLKGARIEVLLSYKESIFVKMGLYELDGLSLSGGGGQAHTVRLTGKSAFFNSGKIREPKSRSFDGLSLGEIIKKIASGNNLTAAIDSELGELKIKHIDQSNESDMHFLTRLARDYDAIFKIAGERLIFTQRGNGLSITGQALKALKINLSPKISYNLQTEDKEAFDKAVVYYHDKSKGGRSKVEVGSGKKVYKHKRTMPTKEEAEAKAQSLLAQKARKTLSLDLIMPGEPALTAESSIVIVEPNIPMLNGRWIIEKVSHKISPTGFTTSVACYPETGEALKK